MVSLLTHGTTYNHLSMPRRKFVEPGAEVVVDESMGKWIPFFENTPEGLPHLSKIIRKPEGIGVEYKDVADAFDRHYAVHRDTRGKKSYGKEEIL